MNLEYLIEAKLNELDEKFDFESHPDLREYLKGLNLIKQEFKVTLVAAMREVAIEMGQRVVPKLEDSQGALVANEWILMEKVWNSCRAEVERRVTEFLESKQEH